VLLVPIGKKKEIDAAQTGKEVRIRQKRTRVPDSEHLKWSGYSSFERLLREQYNNVHVYFRNKCSFMDRTSFRS
jgi:hypothetical protein